MRESTELYVHYKQPGLKDSETSAGPLPVKDAIRFMAQQLARDPMKGSHIEFRLSSDKAKARFPDKRGDQDINEILGGFDFTDEESES